MTFLPEDSQPLNWLILIQTTKLLGLLGLLLAVFLLKY